MMPSESLELRHFVDALRNWLELDPLYGGGYRGRRYRVWPTYRGHQDNNYMTTQAEHR